MKPIGTLMWENRLIEKMLQVVVSEAGRMEAGAPGQEK